MAAIRLAMLALLFLGLLLAAEPLALIRAGQPAGGWEFGNGPEFPGAVGTLALDDGVEPQRRPALVPRGQVRAAAMAAAVTSRARGRRPATRRAAAED